MPLNKIVIKARDYDSLEMFTNDLVHWVQRNFILLKWAIPDLFSLFLSFQQIFNEVGSK